MGVSANQVYDDSEFPNDLRRCSSDSPGCPRRGSIRQAWSGQSRAYWAQADWPRAQMAQICVVYIVSYWTDGHTGLPLVGFHLCPLVLGFGPSFFVLGVIFIFLNDLDIFSLISLPCPLWRPLACPLHLRICFYVVGPCILFFRFHIQVKPCGVRLSLTYLT